MSPKKSPLARSVSQLSKLRNLHVVTPDGKCPVCRGGEVVDKVMVGPVTVPVCRSCGAKMFYGLELGHGLLRFIQKWVG